MAEDSKARQYLVKVMPYTSGWCSTENHCIQSELQRSNSGLLDESYSSL